MSVLDVTRRMHVYNRWANKRILDSMEGMSADDLIKDQRVAFGNLRGALWHLAGAQMGWLRVCSNTDTWSRNPVRDSNSIDGLREIIVRSDEMWSEFLASLTEEQITGHTELPMDDNFRNSVGPDLLEWSEKHGHRPMRPMWQSVLHVVNHGTQHRAEIGMFLASEGRSPDDMDYGTFEEHRAVHGDTEITGAIR